MRKFIFSLCSIALCLTTTRATDNPRGNLLELHSCELYAGGCVVSSEEPMDGRQMLRIWNFTGGGFGGADFTNLKLAVLQSSPDNLAESKSRSGDAVVYLPQVASKAQREALMSWLKETQKDFKPTRLYTRIVPLLTAKADNGYTFTAGEAVKVKTAPLDSCETGSCGEALWYSPHAESSVFTVVLNRSSKITEPLLQLKWNDAAKRSIFFARFGEASSKQVYVSESELCSPKTSFF